MAEIPVNLSSFRNIIFDLGGVLINLNIQASVDALQKLSRTGHPVPYSQKEQAAVFDLLEVGDIAPAEFRRRLREEFDLEGSDAEIDEAWNAMLLDVPTERIAVLQRLAQTHRLFLLSNTNAIHYQRFNQIVQESLGLPGLDSLFEQAYYSHLLRQRKPHPEVFEHLVATHQLKKNETLFIDDSYQHIAGARQAGIHALHLAPPLTITDLFPHA